MDYKNVKHGCVDCVDYKTDVKKEPCKSCKRWSNWKENVKDVKKDGR